MVNSCQGYGSRLISNTLQFMQWNLQIVAEQNWADVRHLSSRRRPSQSAKRRWKYIFKYFIYVFFFFWALLLQIRVHSLSDSLVTSHMSSINYNIIQIKNYKMHHATLQPQWSHGYRSSFPVLVQSKISALSVRHRTIVGCSTKATSSSGVQTPNSGPKGPKVLTASTRVLGHSPVKWIASSLFSPQRRHLSVNVFCLFDEW